MTEFTLDSSPGYQPLFKTLRGGIVESVHYGAVAVVSQEGKLFAQAGNPQSKTFLRSSAKPFQCIPLLEMGGGDRYKLKSEELAVICASHSGTDQHLRTIIRLQRKIGVKESDLLCCTHLPSDPASRRKLKDLGHSPSQNHHNCSGKHTGMLGQASLMGQSLEAYTEIDHPVQQGILTVFSEMCGLEKDQIGIGRDGCSVPTFAVPLYNAAWAWAKLADPSSLAATRADACRQITSAMANQPFYVAGPGKLDTRLMETAPGKLISKAGAEAFQAIGVLPNAIKPGSPALGIAIKISDGDQGKRALAAVSLEVLSQLGVLSSEELQEVGEFGPVKPILNQCGLPAGESRPCFQLQYS